MEPTDQRVTERDDMIDHVLDAMFMADDLMKAACLVRDRAG